MRLPRVRCCGLVRYFNHLNPDINKGPWQPEEDEVIISRQIEFPNKWANIAREVVGRYVVAAVAIIG